MLQGTRYFPIKQLVPCHGVIVTAVALMISMRHGSAQVSGIEKVEGLQQDLDGPIAQAAGRCLVESNLEYRPRTMVRSTCPSRQWHAVHRSCAEQLSGELGEYAFHGCADEQHARMNERTRCCHVQGKVRDTYLVGDLVVIVTTDRQSAFDRLLAAIPFKACPLRISLQAHFGR